MMKRPVLINFLAIQNSENVSLRAVVSLRHNKKKIQSKNKPIQSLRQLKYYNFTILILFLNDENIVLNKHVCATNKYGTFRLKFSLNKEMRNDLSKIEIYEVSRDIGINYFLGTFKPLKVIKNKKILICDFDKTLVDTKYSTLYQVIKSLLLPLSSFPKVDSSVSYLKKYAKQDYLLFILSASPHFYENAIGKWLTENNISTAAIFLKDYRKIFSILDLELTTKDLSSQGTYKILQLLSILEMADFPTEIILMGDNFELDHIIYLFLSKFLRLEISPTNFVREIKQTKGFIISNNKQILLLNILYRSEDKIKRRKTKIITHIKIRKYSKDVELIIPAILQDDLGSIEFYN